MNFKTFPVASTTVFPISNSTAGGQLITEWNLRCRDMVGSYSEIIYDSVNSYTHSDDDFTVRVYQDDAGTILSNSTLEIMPGTAIVNGHYVKEEARMLVDLLEGNKELASYGEEILTGKLAIGIKAFYSTESSMIGALEPENDDEVYQGLQLIVLPASKLKTPKDSPTDPDQVTCHIKLATFTFLDNEIRGIVNFTGKTRYLDAERIDDLDEALEGEYLTKNGLQPKKLYVLSGKQMNGIVNDTWCDATDSLFVWDENPTRIDDAPKYDSARFITRDTGETALYLPHKNVDGMKKTLDHGNPDYGKDEYYKSIELALPVADFSKNTSGTVDAAYTGRIKGISNKLDNYFRIVKGKQVAYLDTLERDMNKQVKDGGSLPDISNNWRPGDYTLVNIDNHAVEADESDEYNRSPSTIYAVLPGVVQEIKFYGKGVKNSNAVPDALQGVRIGSIVEGDSEPVTTQTVDLADLDVAGYLQNKDIVRGSVSYTTPEGVIYKDNGEGELVYSDENVSEDGGAGVLEADISTYDKKPGQLFTITKETVNDTVGYAIKCGDAYLTALGQYPYKLYFNSELTELGLFLFVNSDSNLNIKTQDDGRQIYPVEIVCKGLVVASKLGSETAKNTLLYGVSNLLKALDGMDGLQTDLDAKIKALVDAIETNDASTALNLAQELQKVIETLFSDNDGLKSDVKKVVDALVKLESEAQNDERVEAIQSAVADLQAFLNDELEKFRAGLRTAYQTIQEQKSKLDPEDGDPIDASVYGHLTAYNEGDLSYITATVDNKTKQQMWQITEVDDNTISIFNSYYGQAITQLDAKELREKRYDIDYADGSILGLPGIGTAKYEFYSSNILGQLLEYFTIDDGTRGVALHKETVYRYVNGDSGNVGSNGQLARYPVKKGSIRATLNDGHSTVYVDDGKGGFKGLDGKALKGAKVDYDHGVISGMSNVGYADYAYIDKSYTQYEDYFVYRYNIDESNYQDYYYVVSKEGPRIWSDPIWITGSIGLATTTSIGGFLNVEPDALDAGYVILNDEGHLQLLDYDLLRAGVAAYQLGEDVTITSGLASEEVQEYLDEYVNMRVAFPNANQIQRAGENKAKGLNAISSDPNIINIYIDLSAEDAANSIDLHGIDSRFGSSIYLHLTGTANSNTTIYISDIERLRIDNTVGYDESDPPSMRISNCGLYYDPAIMDLIAYSNRKLETTGMDGIRLWYKKYEDIDPDLVVDDMTVSEVNAPIITDVIEFWNATSPNDNHFHVALHDITFAHDGTIVGCGLLIANDTTANLEQGHHVSAGKFSLPQGDGLAYPERLLTRRLKITGTFESGYRSGDGYYVLQDTMFTALTQKYDAMKNSTSIDGSVLFHTSVNLLTVDFGGISDEAWEPDTFHWFSGWAMM